MKIFIIAVALLFSASVMAEKEPASEPTHAEKAQFIANSVMTGLALDPEIYWMYVSIVYNRGPEEANMKVAIKYAFCHILWNKVLVNGWTTEELSEEMYAVTSYRALVMTKLYVRNARRDPAEVETYMLPKLNNIPIDVGAGSIAECAALDSAAMSQLEILGIELMPGEDVTPESKEPKSESYSS